MNKLFDTLLKLGVIAALIVAATTKQQYSYYTFVRWVVFTSSIYFIYKSYDKNQIGIVIYFSILAILFNPFKPFWFQKETWQLIDYIVSAFIFGTIYFDLTKHKTER
jgi:hypothetical protein